MIIQSLSCGTHKGVMIEVTEKGKESRQSKGDCERKRKTLSAHKNNQRFDSENNFGESVHSTWLTIALRSGRKKAIQKV